jgi:hypothetical protein
MTTDLPMKDTVTHYKYSIYLIDASSVNSIRLKYISV